MCNRHGMRKLVGVSIYTVAVVVLSVALYHTLAVLLGFRLALLVACAFPAARLVDALLG